MGYGPLLAIDYITPPRYLRIPKWDPNFGNYLHVGVNGLRLS